MRIINAWSPTYSSNGVRAGEVVILANVDGERKLIVEPFLWYFFVDYTPLARGILDSVTIRRRIIRYEKEGEYYKVFCIKEKFKDDNVFALIKGLHSMGVQTYEADVGPAKRYLLDSGHKIEDFDKINLMYLDIETDDRSGSIEYEEKNGMSSIKAKDQILSICCVDKQGKEFFMHDKDEKKLLEQFNKFLFTEKVDMLTGWNSKDFDMAYILKRMKHNKVENQAYFYNILHEDMMKRVQYFYSKDPEARQKITSYSLDFISRYFLNEGKIKFDGGVHELMTKDFEKFKQYNIQDCHLLRKLEDKLGLIKLTYQMFQTCQCTAQNWTMVKTIDNFILSDANKQGVHYITNEAYFKEWQAEEEEREEYLGAFVLDPVPGYYENVYDLDFKSLYPNIIRTFNISPETYKTDVVKGCISTPGTEINGVTRGKAFYDRKEGIIPKQIAILLAQREEIRKEQKGLDKSSREWKDLNVKQLVVKELANSIYGVIGNPYFRGFNVNMAESITGTGQYLIKHLKEIYEAKGRRVIYGDTDSVFVILGAGEDIEKVIQETNLHLESHLMEFGISNCTIQLALDKRIDKFFIEAKKKYVGQTEGRLHYSGMECIKRDTIPIVRDYQRELIKRIFDRVPDVDIRQWISGIRDTITRGDIDPKSITIYKRIGKDTDEYRGKEGKKYTAPVHIRIAKRLSQKGDEKTNFTRSGTIIPYIITSTDPLLDGVHLDEFKGEWDKEYYWEQVIYPPLMRVLDAVYPHIFWDEYLTTKTPVRKIPEKLKKEMEKDPYYKICARAGSECSGPITWEHVWIYAGRQINEKWAIIPLCWHHHLGTGLDKEWNEKCSLGRAQPADLAKYHKKNWGQRMKYLGVELQHEK